MMRRLARYRWLLVSVPLVLALLTSLHYWVRHAARVVPPEIRLPNATPSQGKPGLERFETASLFWRGKILGVELSGTPEQIGYAHARLLYPRMVENERVLLGHFEAAVPSDLARTALVDLALFKYKDVHRGMSEDRVREIAATARGFAPDPFHGFFDTFQRFIYLNALYDISLSFEHSPLIGCTSFLLNLRHTPDGEPLLARNFDFEVDPIFDRDKAVFFVRENGKVPFASVAWPGLVGVVSGMNIEGVGLVVHGARAGTPSESGEPVVHALRRVLSTTTTALEAARALGERPPMVSHIVVILDANGKALVVERAPGHPDHVREPKADASVTNHFEGPLAADPENSRVKEQTSSLARRARADELLAHLDQQKSVQAAVNLLRDRRGLHDQALELGDRKAIDALIATHGVVMNTRRAQLWVSEGPHLLGRFLMFDLPELFTAASPNQQPLVQIASDPALETASVKRRLEQGVR